MSVNYNQITTIVKDNSTYYVYFGYEYVSQTLSTLTTTLKCYLAVKRKTASSSSSVYSDSLFNKSKLWGYQRQLKVTIPYTTDTTNIFWVQKELQHDANGVYNSGNGIDIDFKWGAMSNYVNGTFHVAVPSFNVVEKISSATNMPYNSVTGSVTITNYSKGKYGCKLYYKFDRIVTTYTLYKSWGINERGSTSIKIKPDLAVFNGQSQVNMYLKLDTIDTSNDSVIGSSTKTVQFLAGQNLIPTVALSVAEQQVGNVTLSSLCGTSFVNSYVIPGISAFTLTATPTLISGTTAKQYSWWQYSDEGHKETKNTSNTFSTGRTTCYAFGVQLTDSNDKISDAKFKEYEKKAYKLPTITITNCYLNASGELHCSIKATYYSGTYGNLNNNSMIVYFDYKLHSASSWTTATSETVTSTSYTHEYTKTGLSANSIYDVRVYCGDCLREAKGVNGDGTNSKWTLAYQMSVGLKPVIEFDNSAITLNKPTTENGQLTINGSTTSTGGLTLQSGSDDYIMKFQNGCIRIGANNYQVVGRTEDSSGNDIFQIGSANCPTRFYNRDYFYNYPIFGNGSFDAFRSLTSGTSTDGGYCLLGNGLILAWRTGTYTVSSSGEISIPAPTAVEDQTAYSCLHGMVCEGHNTNSGKYILALVNAGLPSATIHVYSAGTHTNAAQGTSISAKMLWFIIKR